MNRRIMFGLTVVALCAAVLSFDAIRSLAVLCGFTPVLSVLLPLTIDVGAAVATALWLATDAPQTARDYARTLALVLLVASVAANGLSHGLSAYQVSPPWWVVVLVSAIPAAVLGAAVHLVVLARPSADPETPAETDDAPPTEADEAASAYPGLGSGSAQPAHSGSCEPVAPVAVSSAVQDWTVERAAQWALDELRNGTKVVGWKRINTHTGLTESPARRAAAQAKDMFEHPVRSVVNG